MPAEPLPNEPDLDAEGKPEIVEWRDEDGNVFDQHLLPRTKRDNCADLAYAAGGLDKVTDAQLQAFGLTRREYTYFVLDHDKRMQDTRLHYRFERQMLEAGFSEADFQPKTRTITREEAIRIINEKRAHEGQPPITPEDLGYGDKPYRRTFDTEFEIEDEEEDE